MIAGKYRFEIKDKEESKKVQSMLFDLGVSWRYAKDKEILGNSSKYIFVDGKRLSFSSNPVCFLKKGLNGHLTLDLCQLSILHKSKGRSKVKVPVNCCDCGEDKHHFGYHIKGCPAKSI